MEHFFGSSPHVLSLLFPPLQSQAWWRVSSDFSTLWTLVQILAQRLVYFLLLNPSRTPGWGEHGHLQGEGLYQPPPNANKKISVATPALEEGRSLVGVGGASDVLILMFLCARNLWRC